MAKRIIMAAAFDGDGILFDTEVFQYLGWKDTIKELSGKDLSKVNYIGKYCGNSSIENAKNAAEDYGIKMDPLEVLAIREKYVLQNLRKQQINKMFYADYVLSSIAKQVPTAITTGSGLEETKYKLEQTRLDNLVEKHSIKLVTSEDVENGKPAPDTYIVAAERLGVDPRNMVAFEDTRSGYVSAKKAGAIAFAIPTPWSSSKIGDARKFSNLADALTFINTNYKFQPKR